MKHLFTGAGALHAFDFNVKKLTPKPAQKKDLSGLWNDLSASN